MFTVVWDDLAFDQMNALVLWYPHRRAEFASALRNLDREWHQSGDTWGESRADDARLGFEGPLEVLVRVDAVNQVVNVIEVQLR